VGSISIYPHTIFQHISCKNPAKDCRRKEAGEKLLSQPKIINIVPKYSSRIIPITKVAIIALPGKPIIGEIDRKLRIAYKTAK
jgi:hypothetical protein